MPEIKGHDLSLQLILNEKVLDDLTITQKTVNSNEKLTIVTEFVENPSTEVLVMA